MDTKLKEAIKLLGTYTAGRYDVWILAGPAKRSCRKLGVTAMRDAFEKGAGIEGGCQAERDERFVAFCEEVMRCSSHA